MERSVLEIKLKDKGEISMSKNKANGNNFLNTAKRLKWDWAGHVSRQNEGRWIYKIKKEGRGASKPSDGMMILQCSFEEMSFIIG